MSKIRSIDRDPLTGYRVGRCGSWYVRARPGGQAYDLARPPPESWEELRSEFTGVAIDQTARLLGVPRGDLYEWGRE